MKKGLFKKILLGSLSVFTLLVVVLCVHIYIVTRPKPADAHTVAMARIDFKQTISNEDAAKISNWISMQKGVDHVVCNANSHMALFTFFPVKNSADNIISGLTSGLHYDAVRFKPSAEDMKNGCPMNSNSVSYKAVAFIKNIF